MAKNLKELNEILKNYIGTALILTQWDIREILEKKVEEYYDEYQPVLYERTWKLRNSLQCSNIKFEKKGVSCTVGWDNYYIAMRYTGGATGEQVLYWFNDKSHGGRVQGEHKFWDEAIEEINEIYGGIPNLFKRNCKKSGRIKRVPSGAHDKRRCVESRLFRACRRRFGTYGNSARRKFCGRGRGVYKSQSGIRQSYPRDKRRKTEVKLNSFD